MTSPCWVHGAATPAELTLVHVWNEMVALQNNVGGYDGSFLAGVTMDIHLTHLCQRLRPVR